MTTKEYNYLHKVIYYNSDISEEEKDIQYKKDFLNVFYLNNYDEKKIENSRTMVFDIYKNNEQFKSIFSNFKKHQKNFPFELSNETIFCFLFSFNFFSYTHKCLGELYIYNKISDETYNKLINIIKN